MFCITPLLLGRSHQLHLPIAAELACLFWQAAPGCFVGWGHAPVTGSMGDFAGRIVGSHRLHGHLLYGADRKASGYMKS